VTGFRMGCDCRTGAQHRYRRKLLEIASKNREEVKQVDKKQSKWYIYIKIREMYGCPGSCRWEAEDPGCGDRASLASLLGGQVTEQLSPGYSIIFKIGNRAGGYHFTAAMHTPETNCQIGKRIRWSSKFGCSKYRLPSKPKRGFMWASFVHLCPCIGVSKGQSFHQGPRNLPLSI
jgi:hypothetical protein